MSYIISGIQQMGVGVKDADQAWAWYRRYFGADIPIFEERAEAALMLPYTGGQPRSRYAILAINLQGGGGFEIWQYTSRTPEAPKFDIQLGDLGFYATKIKSRDIQKTYEFYKSKQLNLLTPIRKSPNGQAHFFVQDPYNNVFQIVESDNWFLSGKGTTGSVYGAIIGVTSIEKSLEVYRDILGYDVVEYDVNGKMDCFEGVPGGQSNMRRVLLTHGKARVGAFSKMLGKSEIELVQVQDRTPRKIFENRLWGDLGFIHLCFDINGMADLKQTCEDKGFPFTVDSGDFDMGEAAGHFAYIEDPDGTLIEFVQTHKIPILKKIGWYLDLRKRNPKKALPNLMLRALGLNRKKD